MVTCQRILSSDHGDHLLVQDRLLNELDPAGGLDALGGGRWGQRLHRAMMPEISIKSGSYRYADVFGFYDDAPLLHAQNVGYLARTKYHVGSHDCNSLDL